MTQQKLDPPTNIKKLDSPEGIRWLWQLWTRVNSALQLGWGQIDTTGSDINTIGGILNLSKGGTHSDLSATGGAHNFVKQSSTGANLSVGTIAIDDLPTTDTVAQTRKIVTLRV